SVVGSGTWCVHVVTSSCCGPVGEQVVVVGQPEHYRGRFDIGHHFGERTHLRGAVAPVPYIIDMAGGHGTLLVEFRERNATAYDTFPAKPNVLGHRPQRRPAASPSVHSFFHCWSTTFPLLKACSPFIKGRKDFSTSPTPLG